MVMDCLFFGNEEVLTGKPMNHNREVFFCCVLEKQW